ncbi:MAG: hypothetical protein HY961_05585 [Ignavibacteriae bacterium]|nr:hypothetical protein [Ignavibacteriota bacterium]
MRLYSFFRIRLEPYQNLKQRKGNNLGDPRFDKYAMLRENYVEADSHWASTYRHILLARDLLREKGIDFWLTTYPYGLQVHPKEWSMGRDYWQFKRDTVYSTWPQEKLGRWAASQEIRFIDFSPKFKELSKKVFPIFYDINGHWLAVGHELVSDALFEELQPYFLHKVDSLGRRTAAQK